MGKLGLLLGAGPGATVWAIERGLLEIGSRMVASFPSSLRPALLFLLLL